MFTLKLADNMRKKMFGLLMVGALLCLNGYGQQGINVLYINSYHPGYGSSDSVMAALRTILGGQPGLRLHTVFMDAKRRPDRLSQKADSIFTFFQSLQPAAVIVSDDDAVREVVVPYLKNTQTPVVFCGVNWSAREYDMPSGHITGMLEVVPIRETLRSLLVHYPKAKKLAVLSENSPAEHKNRQLLDTLYRNLGLETTYYLVDEFSAWKEGFQKASQTADLVYLPTNGSIRGWKDTDAKAFVHAHIKVPILTCDDFMMPYAVYGQTKVAREQGQWAAQAVLAILDGTSPAAIAVTHNKQSTRWLNRSLAQKIQFLPDNQFFKLCRTIP